MEERDKQELQTKKKKERRKSSILEEGE